MKHLYAMPIIMFFLCIGVVFLRIKTCIVFLVRDVYLEKSLDPMMQTYCIIKKMLLYYQHTAFQNTRFQKFVWFSIIYFPQCTLNSAEEIVYSIHAVNGGIGLPKIKFMKVTNFRYGMHRLIKMKLKGQPMDIF
jgi:hypothetical protein